MQAVEAYSFERTGHRIGIAGSIYRFGLVKYARLVPASVPRNIRFRFVKIGSIRFNPARLAIIWPVTISFLGPGFEKRRKTKDQRRRVSAFRNLSTVLRGIHLAISQRGYELVQRGITNCRERGGRKRRGRNGRGNPCRKDPGGLKASVDSRRRNRSGIKRVQPR